MQKRTQIKRKREATAKPKSSPFEKYRGIGSGQISSGRTAILRAIRELRGR